MGTASVSSFVKPGTLGQRPHASCLPLHAIWEHYAKTCTYRTYIRWLKPNLLKSLLLCLRERTICCALRVDLDSASGARRHAANAAGPWTSSFADEDTVRVALPVKVTSTFDELLSLTSRVLQVPPSILPELCVVKTHWSMHESSRSICPPLVACTVRELAVTLPIPIFPLLSAVRVKLLTVAWPLNSRPAPY